MNTSRIYLKKHWLQIIFMGMLAILLFRAGVAQATSPAHQKTWKVVSSPNVGISDQLNGVAAISTTDVWAVGEYNNSSNVQQTLIEQWNGTSWSVVPSPNVGSSSNILDAVAAVSASDIWAVGTTYGHGALIEHWDGSSWSVVSNPGTGALYGVTVVSASDVWAVGDNGQRVQIENWNGTSWSIVPAPKLGGFGGTLEAVTAISTNNIWAVGIHGVNQYTQDPLVEHWDGTQWSTVGNPSNGDHNVLLGVSFVSPNNGWAVGTYSFISSPPQTLIDHWNGASWSDVNDGLMDKTLSAVAAISNKDAWAVGYTDNPQTLIEHWDGTQWSIVPSPAPGSYSQLHGVARVPGTKQLWAVGGYGASNLATLTEFYG
jgi:hypothetical protein